MYFSIITVPLLSVEQNYDVPKRLQPCIRVTNMTPYDTTYLFIIIVNNLLL